MSIDDDYSPRLHYHITHETVTGGTETIEVVGMLVKQIVVGLILEGIHVISVMPRY